MKNKNILNFIFELGQLKKIRHDGFRLAGVDNGNLPSVAEHSLRAAQIGFILAKMEKYKNPHEIAVMLVFHDLRECRTGDINKISGRYLSVDKEKIDQEQLGKLGVIGKEIFELIQNTNYKKGKVGIIAKDADYLEQAVTAKEYLEKGIKPAQTWINNAGKVLQTKSARALWKLLKNYHSSEWWKNFMRVDKYGKVKK